jgi:hypothetical protein
MIAETSIAETPMVFRSANVHTISDVCGSYGTVITILPTC